MNELITIGNFPTNAIGIRSFKEDLKAKILSGEGNAGEAKVLLKAMEIVLKDLQKDAEIKEVFEDFANRYTEKTFQFKGMQFTKTQKKIYNYKSCGDTKYDEMTEKLEQLKADIAAREAFLKAIKEPIYDSEGTQINPPTYTWETGLSLKPL